MWQMHIFSCFQSFWIGKFFGLFVNGCTVTVPRRIQSLHSFLTRRFSPVPTVHFFWSLFLDFQFLLAAFYGISISSFCSFLRSRGQKWVVKFMSMRFGAEWKQQTAENEWKSSNWTSSDPIDLFSFGREKKKRLLGFSVMTLLLNKFTVLSNCAVGIFVINLKGGERMVTISALLVYNF